MDSFLSIMRKTHRRNGEYGKLPIFSILLFLYSSCSNNPYPNGPGKNEYFVSATLYNQLSGEYRALVLQAYNLAKLRLDEKLSDTAYDKYRDTIKYNFHFAVIVDLDETILDNSAFQGQLIKDDSSYMEEWKEYVNEAKANAVPGSKEFLDYVDSCNRKYKLKQIHIYYITNRTIRQKEATALNLKTLEFPQISIPLLNNNNLIPADNDTATNKESRFEGVKKKDTVLLQIGDNLNDLTGDFYGRSDAVRRFKVDSLERLGKIGKDYIVIPNAMYGDWLISGLPKRDKDAAISRRLNLNWYK